MQIDKEIDLYKFSTMRTHSIATVMYTPRNLDELREAIAACNGKCYFLGGGSNVVFASTVKTPVINLMELNCVLLLNPDGSITAGCSVRIQNLINFGKDNSLGGFEYLYSLPASVGGIVYMNAGRGRVHNQCISDWLDSVDYLDLVDMCAKKMKVDRNKWTYRHSPFQEKPSVILSATFRMQQSSMEDVAGRIRERIATVKANQEADKPSCGSVFNHENRYLMRLMRGKRIGGAMYSKKANNWISNDRNGSAEDVIALIEYAEKWHKRLGLKCVSEIRIFK